MKSMLAWRLRRWRALTYWRLAYRIYQRRPNPLNQDALYRARQLYRQADYSRP